MMQIEFEGAELLKRQLGQLTTETRNELRKAVAACAFKLEGNAKASIQRGGRTGRVYDRWFYTDAQGRLRLGGARSRAHQASAPGEPPKADRGGLAQNISTAFEDGGMAATVGSRAAAFYGRLLELGTSKIAPRPWLLPAFMRLQGFISDRLAQAADTAIGKVGR